MHIQTLVSAVENILKRFRGQITYGGLQRGSIFLTYGLHLPEYRGVLVFPQRGYASGMD